MFYSWICSCNIFGAEGRRTQTPMLREIFLSKNHAQNEAGRIVLDLFLFFRKALYHVKASDLQLSFNIFP